jgi:hypothetical protein
MTAQWNSTSTLAEIDGSTATADLSLLLESSLTVLPFGLNSRGGLEDYCRNAVPSPQVDFVEQTAFFVPNQFDGLFCSRRLFGQTSAAAKSLRPFLKANGRLILAAVVRVGAGSDADFGARWLDQMKTPPPQSNRLLIELSLAGFEPELTECHSIDWQADASSGAVSVSLSAATAGSATKLRAHAVFLVSARKVS